MAITITAEAGAKKAYGIMIMPGLGVAWNGELKRLMSTLFNTRISNIPWLPVGWLAAVQDLQARFPDDLVVLAPSMGSIHPNPDMPDWVLRSQDRMDVWMAIYRASNEVRMSFAASKQAEGKAQLDALYRNAAFWDGAYNLAVNVRDAIPNAAGFVVSNLWNGLGWKLKLTIGFVGAAAAVWYGPKIAKLASKYIRF